MQAPWPGKCFLVLQCWHSSSALFSCRLVGGGTGVASTAADVGHVGAVGEPTCHGGGARGGDMVAEGVTMSHLGGGHVGAVGEPTCHWSNVRGGGVGAGGEPPCQGGGGRGGGVGAVGEPTPHTTLMSWVGAGSEPTREAGGEDGGVA